MQSRIVSLAVVGAALLFLIDLFLPWSRADFGRGTAWETGPGILAGTLAVLLLAWEAGRLAGIWSGLRAEGYIAFVIGSTAAILGVSTLILLGTDLPNRQRIAYGGWIGLALSIILLAASAWRLLEHRRLIEMERHRARQPA